jgi:NitT/TauT family transport system substrate-binding protein
MARTAKTLVKDMVPGAMTVVFVYSGKFMKERREVAKKFMVALMKGARAMQGKHYLDKKNMAAYMKYQRSSEEAIRKGMPMLFDPNLTIYTETERACQCFLIRISPSIPRVLGISNGFI